MSSNRLVQRVVSAATCALCAIAAPALALDRGVSGIWYNPAQAGHGFEITVVSPTSAAVTWYTYNADGAPVWVAGVLTESAPGVINGSVNYYHGMVFGQFVPGTNASYTWGSLRITFQDCSAARVDYNGVLRYSDGSGFGAGSVALQKLAAVPDVNCGAGPATGLAGIYLGGAQLGASGEGRGAYVLLENAGTATLVVPGEAAYSGTYAFSGSGVSFNLAGQADAGLTFPNGSATAVASGTGTARGGDFLRGTFTSAGRTGSFSFLYLGLSTRATSLATVAGDYVDLSGESALSLSVSSSGAVTGRLPGGCLFGGTLAPIAGLGAYTLSATVGACGANNGTYSGKVLLADIQDFGAGDGLVIALRGPQNAVTGLLARN